MGRRKGKESETYYQKQKRRKEAAEEIILRVSLDKGKMVTTSMKSGRD